MCATARSGGRGGHRTSQWEEKKKERVVKTVFHHLCRFSTTSFLRDDMFSNKSSRILDVLHHPLTDYELIPDQVEAKETDLMHSTVNLFKMAEKSGNVFSL